MIMMINDDGGYNDYDDSLQYLVKGSSLIDASKKQLYFSTWRATSHLFLLNFLSCSPLFSLCGNSFLLRLLSIEINDI